MLQMVWGIQLGPLKLYSTRYELHPLSHLCIDLSNVLSIVPSSGPVMFRVINLTAISAVFTWNAPPLEDCNGIMIGYSINVTKLQAGERQELFSNSTMITVYSLQPYMVYFCISTALTSAGHGPSVMQRILRLLKPVSTIAVII